MLKFIFACTLLALAAFQSTHAADKNYLNGLTVEQKAIPDLCKITNSCQTIDAAWLKSNFGDAPLLVTPRALDAMTYISTGSKLSTKQKLEVFKAIEAVSRNDICRACQCCIGLLDAMSQLPSEAIEPLLRSKSIKILQSR